MCLCGPGTSTAKRDAKPAIPSMHRFTQTNKLRNDGSCAQGTGSRWRPTALRLGVLPELNSPGDGLLNRCGSERDRCVDHKRCPRGRRRFKGCRRPRRRGDPGRRSPPLRGAAFDGERMAGQRFGAALSSGYADVGERFPGDVTAHTQIQATTGDDGQLRAIGRNTVDVDAVVDGVLEHRCTYGGCRRIHGKHKPKRWSRTLGTGLKNGPRIGTMNPQCTADDFLYLM